MDTMSPELVREETLWFADGTLVLQAETRLFRVSPGVLAAKSPVFQDMLGFPQPQNGESYDGCPLVHLLDSAADTTHFLRAIFHYDYFEPWPARLDFDVVAGVLRLSQKYQLDPLRKRALVHLSRRYPITFDEFGCTDEWYDPIAVANLARHASADWVLPVVLTACAWLNPEKLLNGGLTSSDVLLCLRARDLLQTRWSSRILEFLLNPPLEISECQTPQSCLETRIHNRALAETWREEKTIVLYLWHEDTWTEVDFVEEPCGVCRDFLTDASQASRQDCWDNLPSLFGLPNWSTLRDQRTTALGYFARVL
ncbi:hypothetical protein C8R45DRAFT_1040501 [Mycena sanguinolenta]|nr:hypothetical protein C8R45DRAFT_1040501 [Mycena sanguinolenta]